MINFRIVLLARVVHVVAGIVWAGGAFVMAAIIVPMTTRYASEGFARWSALIARRVGPILGIAALLTVLSGGYLMMTLHASDTSASGLVLHAGALAALLAFAAGLVSQMTGRRLTQLNEARSAASSNAVALSPELLQKITALDRRTVLSSRVGAVLIGLAVLAMALFRYAAAL